MFVNKQRRLREYDYSLPGPYFVTTCVKNREQAFGRIENGHTVLSPAGLIARREWLWLAEQYDYVRLDAFVIMPDHMHGLIGIDNDSPGDAGRDPHLRGKIKPLTELMGAFKTRSSKFIRQAGYGDFSWQRSFYDRVVRNPGELRRIRRYIIENPDKGGHWEVKK